MGRYVFHLRASMATGRLVNEIETWDNCTPYYGQSSSWGHRLIENNINTVSIGKLHYRSEKDSTGFNEQIVPMHIIEGVGMSIQF